MLMQWVVPIFLIGAIAPSVAAQTAARVRCDSIQYRFVDTTAAPSRRRYRDPGSGRSYALKDTIVLQAADIQRVSTWRGRLGRDTVWDVVATLTADGARRFAVSTGAHVGQIIAVRVGEELTTTALVESSLGGRVPIITNVSAAVADSVLARVQHATSASCRGQ